MIVASRSVERDRCAVPVQVDNVSTGIGERGIGIVDDAQNRPLRHGGELAGGKVTPVGVAILPAGGITEHNSVIRVLSPDPSLNDVRQVPRDPPFVPDTGFGEDRLIVVLSGLHPPDTPRDVGPFPGIVFERVVSRGAVGARRCADLCSNLVPLVPGGEDAEHPDAPW